MKTLMKWMLVAAVSVAQFAWAGPTKEDAVALVKQAVETYKTSGQEKLVAEVNTPNGPFHKGELYAFVWDLNGTVLAVPFPDMRGRNDIDKPDVDGKLFRKEIVQNARAGKSGWVEYKFRNPATGNVEPKIAYYETAGDVVIVAGVYKK